MSLHRDLTSTLPPTLNSDVGVAVKVGGIRDVDASSGKVLNSDIVEDLIRITSSEDAIIPTIQDQIFNDERSATLDVDKGLDVFQGVLDRG